MSNDAPIQIAIVYPGDVEARRSAMPERSRFSAIFDALAARGAQAIPVVYHDDFAEAVRAQLRAVDGALVWVNPIEHGRDRTRLDALLREVAARGVFVSTHPDVIDRLGTKEVLYATRTMSWGLADTAVYASATAFRQAMETHRVGERTRVIKLARGNGGNAVWKIAPAAGAMISLQHAMRGSRAERIGVADLTARFTRCFDDGGCIVDQAYQARLPEGMVRCYLVHDTVAGFGLQAVNALCPAPLGAEPPAPTTRLYYPPELPQCAPIKRQMESEWLPELQRLLSLERMQLPVIWDCDFLLGEKNAGGDDSYVLCEINVSCVAPFPDAAIEAIAAATLERAREARSRRRVLQ